MKWNMLCEMSRYYDNGHEKDSRFYSDQLFWAIHAGNLERVKELVSLVDKVELKHLDEARDKKEIYNFLKEYTKKEG